jgi:hypothetical protein
MSTFSTNLSVTLQNTPLLDFDSSQYANLLLMFAMMFNKHKSYYKRQLLLRVLISFQLLLRFSVGMVRELADSTRDVTCY